MSAINTTQALVLALTLGVCTACSTGSDHATVITPAALMQQMATEQKPLIIDVRTAQEYNAGHVPSAINIPHTEIASRLAELTAHKDEPVVLYCQSGVRVRSAADALHQAGFTQILHLEGDMGGWQRGNFPQER